MRLHLSWPLIVVTLQKFTLSFLCWLIALWLLIYAHHTPVVSEQSWLIQLLATMFVFTPLIVSSERAGVMKWSVRIRLLGSVITIILACVYGFFWLPGNLDGINEDRYIIQIGVHVILTWSSLLWIVPAMMKWNAKDTWAHAYKLVLETIVTGVFCWVLFGGLAAALWAINYLFNLTIPSQRYADLATVIFLGFGVLYWLSHLSVTPLVYTYTQESFPKLLRVFAEYLLWFLLVVYALILVAYTFKIVVSGIWPDGMVASLIFGFVGMWIIYSAILLPYHYDRPTWRVISRTLGVLFIWCAILLVAALQLRVAEYGWTVKRTYIVLIAVWIVAVAISLLFARPSLKSWILSGTIVALLGMYGPVNVFTVAKNDQLARLTSELSSLGISKPGDRASSIESTSTTQNISSRVDYLLRYHGTWALVEFVLTEAMVPRLDQASDPYGAPYGFQNAWMIGSAVMSGWWLNYEPDAMTDVSLSM